MMAKVYNFSYMGGGDWEDCGLANPGKKSQRTPPQPMAGCGEALSSTLSTSKKKKKKKS
jgi:hypothetical protein